MSSQGCDHHGHSVHFFKVILESSLRDGELRIPRSFVSRYWQGISNPVFLRLPNGDEWKVNWIKCDGEVWFSNGWKQFAVYLSLDVGQFVLFRYEGKSHFQVVIFHTSALEIEYPLHKGNDECEEVDESDYSLEIWDDFSPFHGKWPKSPSPFSQTRKKMKTNPKEGPAECYPSPHAETKGAQSKTTMHEKKKSHAGFDTADPKNSGSSSALERAQNFSSENPFFICTLGLTYTNRDLLVVPTDFSKAYLHKKQGKATLCVNHERPWNVKLKLFCNRQTVISGGWRKFFQGNNLKLGDVCVFVLNKCKGVSFRVVIFRDREDSSTPLLEDQEGLSHRPSSSLRNPETFKANSRFMSSKNHFCIFIKHAPLHFATIPIDFFRSYIKHNGKYATLRVGKRSWPVKVLYYPNYSSGRFSLGWTDFLRDCTLKEGDACRFQMIDKENLVFKVQILRDID